MAQQQITITEALAELNTLSKRIRKKQDSVYQYLYRQDIYKDPLEKEGGCRKFIDEQRQGIKDLQDRVVRIRTAIARSNDKSELTVNDRTMTVAEWLTWKREISHDHSLFLSTLQSRLNMARRDAQRKGLSLVQVGDSSKPEDVVVNVDETKLAKEIEDNEIILGELDGKLSLVNATTVIEV